MAIKTVDISNAGVVESIRSELPVVNGNKNGLASIYSNIKTFSSSLNKVFKLKLATAGVDAHTIRFFLHSNGGRALDMDIVVHMNNGTPRTWAFNVIEHYCNSIGYNVSTDNEYVYVNITSVGGTGFIEGASEMVILEEKPEGLIDVDVYTANG